MLKNDDELFLECEVRDLTILRERENLREYGSGINIYYNQHREERIEYQKRRYQQKREELIEYQKQRYEEKKEYLRAYQRTRYYKKKLYG